MKENEEKKKKRAWIKQGRETMKVIESQPDGDNDDNEDADDVDDAVDDVGVGVGVDSKRKGDEEGERMKGKRNEALQRSRQRKMKNDALILRELKKHQRRDLLLLF